MLHGAFQNYNQEEPMVALVHYRHLVAIGRKTGQAPAADSVLGKVTPHNHSGTGH